MKQAIIMAAGKGTRMKSTKPKVLHKICDKTMIETLVDTISKTGVEKICTVVGYGKTEVMDLMAGKCEFAVQQPQLGTGHAVMMAKQFEDLKGKTLVVNGDCPCVSQETFIKMFDQITQNTPMCVLTVKLTDAKEYGRIIKDQEGNIKKIVEFKDANPNERLTKEINTGIYCFDNQMLFKYLNEIKPDNDQKEYYITDLVEIFNQHGHFVKAISADSIEEVQGINNKKELAFANKYMQQKINEKHMENGVEIIDPNNTYIGNDVIIGKEVIIYPNVYITGNTTIGDNSVIEIGSLIKNSKLGNNCHIITSRIINSEVCDYEQLINENRIK